jgi:hypothetical protein
MIRKKKKKNLYRRAKKKLENFLFDNRVNIHVVLASLMILAGITTVLYMIN